LLNSALMLRFASSIAAACASSVDRYTSGTCCDKPGDKRRSAQSATQSTKPPRGQMLVRMRAGIWCGRVTGRRRAKRDGNQTAKLFGAPVHAVVGPRFLNHLILPAALVSVACEARRSHEATDHICH
jgi:hypothetical protein